MYESWSKMMSKLPHQHVIRVAEGLWEQGADVSRDASEHERQHGVAVVKLYALTASDWVEPVGVYELAWAHQFAGGHPTGCRGHRRRHSTGDRGICLHCGRPQRAVHLHSRHGLASLVDVWNGVAVKSMLRWAHGRVAAEPGGKPLVVAIPLPLIPWLVPRLDHTCEILVALVVAEGAKLPYAHPYFAANMHALFQWVSASHARHPMHLFWSIA